MEFNARPNAEHEYVSTNPFAGKGARNAGDRAEARKEGKRPRILKPIYSVRLS